MIFLTDNLRRARSLGVSFKAALIMLVLSFISIVFEGVGIAMLLPIFDYVQNNGDVDKLVQQNGYWAHILKTLNWLGVPVALPTLLCISFAAILARQLFTFLRIRCRARVAFGGIHHVRERAFHLSLRAQTSRQEGTLVGEAVIDVAVELPKAIAALYGTVDFASQLLLVAGYLTGLFLLATWMTAVSLGLLAIIALLLLGLFRQSLRTSAEITNANRRFGTFLVERLRSLRLIRLCGTERAEFDNLSKLSAKQRDNEIRLRTLAAIIDATIEPVAIFIGFAVLYLGYSQFNMPLGRLGLFMLIMMRLLPLTRQAIGAYQGVIGQWASLRIMDERIRLLSQEREPKGGWQELKAVHSGIRYDGVSFAYTDDVPALHDVTCEIPATGMTALVGPSGSGKSTFIDLLPRLRDPNEGTISIDGIPLAEYAVRSLRTGIAFVPQAPQIFNVSAAAHIRYGRADASDADVRAAAKLAGAAEFIQALPEGYDTLLGEDGQKLSGGQRQRLDIARALVRRASILIFDEPTSQLDADGEQEFRHTLMRIRSETGALIIIVAHRLSTVAEADQILVFADGTIADRGTHLELMQRSGWYANAFSKQHHLSDRKVAVA